MPPKSLNKFLQKAQASQKDPEAWMAEEKQRREAEEARRREEERAREEAAQEAKEAARRRVEEEQAARRAAAARWRVQVDPETEEEWELERPGGETSRLCVSVAWPNPRPEGRMNCCVFYISGMPQRVYGNARSSDQLPTAVLERCREIGLPTARFEFSGCGRSKGEVPDTGPGGHALMSYEAGLMMRRLLHEFCENMIVIAHSAGNNTVLPEFAEAFKTYGKDRFLAYVNMNLGTRSAAMINDNAAELLNSPEPDYTNLPPGTLMAYDSLDLPTLFVVGKQDLMTPVVDIKAITDRATRLRTAELVELKGKHAFQGAEDTPAKTIQEFLLRVLPSPASV